MMKRLILAAAFILSGNVFADSCDCTKVVGNCSGSAVLSESSGSHGSYHGEVTVTSSAASCSKVEYFVNNTPYSTVLSNKNRDTENIFGTNPLKNKDIQFKACYVCLKKESDTSGGARML